MSFTRRFQHDVFVSYAHLDNEPSKPGVDGWVRILVDRLALELRQRLGTSEVDVWMDYRLGGNEGLTDQLHAAVEASATLLVVMSPAYVQSAWCVRERNKFFGRMAQRKTDGTVFVAHALDVTEKPPELADLLGYTFWAAGKDGVAQRLGVLNPLDDARFIERISQMSYAIKEKLLRLTTNPPTSRISSAPPLPHKRVYIARSTDDLIDQEEGLRSYLMQHKIPVVLAAELRSNDQDDFEAQVRAEIQSCGVYVQLLSAAKGRAAFAGGPRLSVLQARIAEATNVSRLLWRSRELDMSTLPADPHKELLESARACGFEEFKRAVVEAASPTAAKPGRVTANGAMAFVNAEPCDLDFARNIGVWLSSQGIDCYWPLANGSPERVRIEYEDNLLNCDGILWVYGSTDPGWVVAQLRHGRRVLGKRERPVAIGIVEGPPPEKNEVPAAIPDLVVFNCRDGLQPAVLSEFVRRMNELRTEP